MSKAILKFNMNNPGDREEYALATSAGDMYMVLSEFAELLRTKCKYDPPKCNCYEEIREKFIELLNENKVEI